MFHFIFNRKIYNRYSMAAVAGIVLKYPEPQKMKMTVVRDIHKDLPLLSKNEIPVIFFSFMSMNIKEVKLEIDYFKNKFPHAIIIAGGSHVTAEPESTLKMGFDIVFPGYVEKSLTSFLDDLFAGEIKKGIIKEIKINEYDLNRFSGFAGSLNMFSPIEISRGCNGKCRFCQMPWMSKRMIHRSLEAIERIAREHVFYGRFKSWIISPNALFYGMNQGDEFKIERIEELLHTLKNSGIRQLQFGSFPSEINPEMVDYEIMELIRKFCCNRYITIGGQSGSDRILKLMKRSHSVDDIIKSCEIINKTGFIPHVDILFGTPDENESDRKMSFELIDNITRKHRGKVNIHYFIPLPGTAWKNKRGSRIEEDSLKKIRILLETGRGDGNFFNHYIFSEKLRQD